MILRLRRLKIGISFPLDQSPIPKPVRNWLQLLKGPIRSGKYLPEFDGLRFIAILLVVLFHAYAYFYPTNSISN